MRISQPKAIVCIPLALAAANTRALLRCNNACLLIIGREGREFKNEGDCSHANSRYYQLCIAFELNCTVSNYSGPFGLLPRKQPAITALNLTPCPRSSMIGLVRDWLELGVWPFTPFKFRGHLF